MKVKSLIPILSLMLILALSFNACEKEDSQIVDMQLAEDDALSSVLFDDVFTEVETAMEIMEYTLFDDGLKSANEITCKTITIEHPDDTTFWPRTVTIDYGLTIFTNSTIGGGRVIAVSETRAGEIIAITANGTTAEILIATNNTANFTAVFSTNTGSTINDATIVF